jgi:hypothetical protein
MTITVNGVEIEIHGTATVRVAGGKVVIEVGEEARVRLAMDEDHANPMVAVKQLTLRQVDDGG